MPALPPHPLLRARAAARRRGLRRHALAQRLNPLAPEPTREDLHDLQPAVPDGRRLLPGRRQAARGRGGGAPAERSDRSAHRQDASARPLRDPAQSWPTAAWAGSTRRSTTARRRSVALKILHEDVATRRRSRSSASSASSRSAPSLPARPHRRGARLRARPRTRASRSSWSTSRARSSA